MGILQKMGRNRFMCYEAHFDMLELGQCGSVSLPNRAAYEARIENLLACVKAMKIDHTFIVNNDTVTIRLN